MSHSTSLQSVGHNVFRAVSKSNIFVQEHSNLDEKDYYQLLRVGRSVSAVDSNDELTLLFKRDTFFSK